MIGGLILCSLLTASCRRNVFNLGDYQRIVDIESTVDSIDQYHNWQLGSTRTYNITLPTGIGAVKMYVMSANPHREESPVIMAQMPVSDGDEKRVFMYVPNTQQRMYAALLDSMGTYTVYSFFASNQTVELKTLVGNKQTPLTNINKLQALTCLFEEECPQPGDYDYNDIVLRISQEPIGDRQIDIHVTLSAVGATKQIGAGIRLIGYQYESVDSITTEGGASFNFGGTNHDQPLLSFKVWPNELVLQQTRTDHEPLIALFDDAHWAMADDEDIQSGLSKRWFYNTVNPVNEETSKVVPERTITYHVYFREGTNLSDFSLGKLDPFIVETYLASRWEIHGYRYRNAQSLLSYQMEDVRALPWALIIPDGDFRYPKEGRHIGFGKEGTNGQDAGLFGPYSEPKHSFAEWSYNMNNCTDWYLHLFNEAEAY